MRPLRHLGLLMLALAGCGVATARQATEVWSGTLGSNEIVVEINAANPANPADRDGRYFYRRHRLDIRLQGKATADGGIALTEGLRDDDPHPRWAMRAPARDAWDGEWTGEKGQRLPIHLRRVATDALPTAREPGLQALRGDIDRYEWLRLSGLSLQKKKLQRIDGYTLQWLHQPDSAIDLFEVVAGYPPAQLQRINATLRRRMWNWVGNYYGCMSGARADMGEYQTTTTLRHVGPTILSASLASSFDCGGAHPDFGDEPLNLDPRNGRELDLEDVLWLGPGKPLHAATGDAWNKAWSDYRGKRFAPWVVTQLKRSYPREFGKRDDDCDYSDPQVWEFAQWYVTPAGIHLAAYFPRYARVCDDPGWSVLPWRVVDAHRGAVRIH